MFSCESRTSTLIVPIVKIFILRCVIVCFNFLATTSLCHLLFLDKATLFWLTVVQSCLDMSAELEDYQTLSRCQKVKKILPKVLPILLLSVILPTADIGTDLTLITKLYKGLAACVHSDGMRRDYNEWMKCRASDQYCTPERLSKNPVCGRLKKSSTSQYFCRSYKIWSSDWKDYKKCWAQGANKYCSDPARNHYVCGSHPKTASSLLFFFLLNYMMGLVTCIRLEGRKWVPLITALFIFYPQYCKKLILKT